MYTLIYKDIYIFTYVCEKKKRTYISCPFIFYSIALEDETNRGYLMGVKQALNECPQAQLVVCVLPNSSSDRYSALKKYLCVENPGEF